MTETEFERKEKAIAELKTKIIKLEDEAKTIRLEASKKAKKLDDKRDQHIKEVAKIKGRNEKSTMIAFRCTFDQDMFLFDYGLKHNISKSQAVVKAIEEMKERYNKKK